MSYDLEDDHEFGGGHWGETTRVRCSAKVTKINRAMEFAMDRHSKQVRKYTSEPYWVHLAQVAGLFSSVNRGVDSLCIAWLHDIVEDTNTPLSEIGEKFGRRIESGVWWLSDLEEGNRVKRKRLSRERLSNAPPYIQDIKVCDLISNTSSIVLHDPKFAKVYLEEKKLLLECLDKADKRLLELAYKCINY